MKKIFIILAALACTFTAAAQSAPEGIGVSDIRFSLGQDGRVDISFGLTVARKPFSGRCSMIVTPVLRNGSNSVELPQFMVQGRRAAISEQRHALAHGHKINEERLSILGFGESMEYMTSVAFRNWMPGSELVFEAVVLGCNAVADPGFGTVASNLMVADTVRTVRVIELPRKVTVADNQARRFTFVAPISEFERARANIVEGVEFDDNMLLHLGKAVGREKQSHVETFVERNKPGSLMIYFTVANSDIKPGYRGNSIWLEQLVESVEIIENSGDSRVERVVIAGFASPEGTLSFNDRIAWGRASAVKEYILAHTRLKEDKIRVFNGSEDWLGLRQLVEASDMENKAQILEIIDTVPRDESDTSNSRLEQLKRLDGGRTYRYLYDNFFPELRNAAYIKVYYENND